MVKNTGAEIHVPQSILPGDDQATNGGNGTYLDQHYMT